MKLHLFKRLSVLGLSAALVCGSALALSVVTTKTIDVQYADIKLVVDGIQITPKDANGTVVEPFIYNGTTYLPVRALGNALGKQVGWDGNSKTVYIGEQPGQKQYLMEVCPPYETHQYNSWHRCGTYYSANTEYFTMAGQKYTNGLTLAGCYSPDTYALFNLNGAYSSLHMTIGPVDGTEDPSDIAFIVDGRVVAEYEVDTAQYPYEIDVPLNYGLQLKIATTSDGGRYSTGLGNIELF